MRVCPKCGHIDVSAWRQNRWRTNVDFLHWDQTSDIDPTLLEHLKDTKEIQIDSDYAYRNAGKVIERILLQEYKQGGKEAFHIPREHKDHSSKNQRRLDET